MSERSSIATRWRSCLAALFLAVPFAAAAAAVVPADTFPAAAGRIQVGQEVRVEGVPLVAGEAAATLALQRFRVYRPDAVVAVHGAQGVRTVVPLERALFRGTVVGEPGSLVFLSAGAAGDLRGIASVRGLYLTMERPAGSDPATAWAVPAPVAGADPGFACAAGDAPEIAAEALSSLLVSPAGLGEPGALRAADLAIETDFELYSRLGSAAAVADYAGDQIGTISTVYRRDVDTVLEIGFLSVWETSDDPYTVESGFLDALHELGDVWHAQHPTLPRALVHFLSGKAGIQGGIAYHGVLCTPDAPVGGGHWGGGYSLGGNMASLGALRDTFISAHELGHNFRSHHTHCYNDLPTAGLPEIDRCQAGEIRNDGHPCYDGPAGLPPDGGSIMSYCHLHPGGYGNVTLSLGREGAFGNASERVIQRMTSHIESVGCLRRIPATLFADGFESGDTGAWSAWRENGPTPSRRGVPPANEAQ